jgi:hypothetical protein
MRVKWSSRTAEACQVASAFLGLILLVLWIYGAALSGRADWRFTFDAAAAGLAFVAAALFRTPEMVGVALWAFLGVVALVAGLFSLGMGQTGWVVWTQIAVGAAFLALVVPGAASLGPGQRPQAV